MEFEQLPRPVFVGPRLRRGVVIEVVEHAGLPATALEHLPEIAELVGADHIAVVVDPERARPIVVAVDVEMVVPEIGEELHQLAFRMHTAEKRHPFDLEKRLHPLRPSHLRFHVVLPQLSLVLPRVVNPAAATLESQEESSMDCGASCCSTWAASLSESEPPRALKAAMSPGPGTERHAVEGDDGRGRRCFHSLCIRSCRQGPVGAHHHGAAHQRQGLLFLRGPAREPFPPPSAPVKKSRRLSSRFASIRSMAHLRDREIPWVRPR